MNAINAAALGQFGAVYESGTTAIVASGGSYFFALQANSACVFSLLTSDNWSGDSTASFALPAGMTIYGKFTAFTLASGSVIAYKP